MIENLFDILLAREQVILLFGGIFMVLLGILFIADHYWWHMNAARYRGTLVGVRESPARSKQSNNVYFPVVEYQDAKGESIRAETDTGSSALADKIPGRQVTLLVMPEKPQETRIRGFIGLVFGIIFTVIGILLGAVALTQYAINSWTFVVGVILLFILLFWGIGKLAGREEKDTFRERRVKRYRKRLEEKQSLPFLGREEIVSRLREMDARARRMVPVMILIAILLLGAGHYTGRHLYEFMARGEPATGRIVGHESEYIVSDSRYVYYPQVEYTTADGRAVRFRDRLGSSNPTRSPGERLRVIYDPQNPANAMIDRGLWNRALPAGLIVAGLLILLGATRNWIHINRRANRL